MMALIMARLIAQGLSLLAALIACPAIWYRDGAGAAFVALLALAFIGGAVAPSAEERREFEKFSHTL